VLETILEPFGAAFNTEGEVELVRFKLILLLRFSNDKSSS
jgi:hypothetical protein